MYTFRPPPKKETAVVDYRNIYLTVWVLVILAVVELNLFCCIYLPLYILFGHTVILQLTNREKLNLNKINGGPCN